jgi:myo-inositol 2-dehydrogenase/D-chiro-inositol 1-dehydrogenase
MKVGIIGLGNMGQLHGTLLEKRQGITVTGVTDIDAKRREQAAEKFNCTAYLSVDSLLDSGIDMVFITVPNTRHGSLAAQALRKGIHVFVEKPLATSLEDAAAVKEAVKRSGKRIFVGYNRRFAPVYVKARELINQASFSPANINIIQNDGDMQNPPWLTDIKMTGGFMYDTTVHFLDMVQYLLGEITELRALGKAFFYSIVDGFVVQFKLKSGAIGVITSCGHASWISPFERVQIVGDHKSVITEELDKLVYSPALGAVIDGQDYSKLEREEKWGYAQMHDHIFSSLKNGSRALNGLYEGYRVVELIEACYKSSAKDGEIISFSDPASDWSGIL